ncbi:MAG: outer membrane protein assembly factor BamD [Gammaproteobacteria bacterium]|nr:outer membrane protein assembly factor BamD [Gammaproteobacteria bacterium]
MLSSSILTDSQTRSKMRRLTCLALCCALLITLFSLSGCKSTRDLDEAKGGPVAVYKRAQQSLENQDFDNAIRIYEALVARYPFATEARQARLDLIYAYYKGRESESAIDQADTFIRENPTHPRIDYALYIKGMVDFERTPNFLERWFKADLDERPPQTASKSFNSFRKVVEGYPNSEYAPDARRRMIYLRNRLADYQIYVARYYLKRGAWVGSAQRAKQTIEEYDGAPAVRDALEIMIECYENLGLKDLAEQTQQVYVANYSGRAAAIAQKKKSWWKLWG